ncbi:hypothetical protein A4A49_36177 [Nicotiana attenuata]|uniref:Uncharacterized protein n=1 Tax=Nicotiana attenuata TaxID=49451 RepID=A0A1J6HZU9_NICAT|nr:hypothetical protein A4A49_36177 [Nicotiana attenuata]
MDITYGNLKLERNLSTRKLGRCRSTLLVSELIPLGIASNTAYERLSQSMRLVDEEYSNPRSHNKRRKNKAWAFLTRVFALKKTTICDNVTCEESGRKLGSEPYEVEVSRTYGSLRRERLPTGARAQTGDARRS